jgi:hypothetical protein
MLSFEFIFFNPNLENTMDKPFLGENLFKNIETEEGKRGNAIFGVMTARICYCNVSAASGILN